MNTVLGNRGLAPSLAWGGGLVLLALGATLARQAGWIDQEAVTRIVLGATGLMIVWFGNRLPKAMLPTDAARRVARVSGWSMVLSGLVYAGLWVFAPTTLALVLGCAAVALGLAVTLGYGWRLRGRAAT
jgi:hypothetical protein